MSNVDGFDNQGTTPVLKTDLKKKLVVSGLVEDIHYKITNIDNPLFVIGDEPPLVGESVIIQYRFKPYSCGQFGYEHLFLLIISPGRNSVQYFSSISALEEALRGVTLESDETYAFLRIKHLESEILKLKASYHIQ